jgi:hypothetical protein
VLYLKYTRGAATEWPVGKGGPRPQGQASGQRELVTSIRMPEQLASRQPNSARGRGESLNAAIFAKKKQRSFDASVECEEFMCEACSRPHRTGKMSRDHHLQPVEEFKAQGAARTLQKTYCQAHPEPKRRCTSSRFAARLASTSQSATAVL